MRDPFGFAEEGDNVCGGVDAATSGPALCGVFSDSRCYVLQWRHVWGKNVEVGDVCCKIQVIDGQKLLVILVGKDVGFYDGAEYYPPYVPLP